MPKDPKKQTPSSEYEEEFHTSEEEGIVDPNLMGELWDKDPTAVPDDEPEPEPQEEEEEEETEEEYEEEEEPEAEEEVEEPEEEEPITYKVKDKEYDLDTLVKEGLLDNLITQANQQAHFQKLYEETKQQLDVITQQPPQPQPQPQPRPPVSIAQLKAQVMPHVQNAVQQGFIEEDFVEMYPNAAASQMLIYNDYIQMKAVLMGMYKHFMQENAKNAYQSARDKFSSACDSLSSKHDLYQALENEGEREEFFTFLTERVNPEVSALTDEFLARQYLAYKQESVLEAVRTNKNKRKKTKKKKRKLAVGEGGSPRKGGKKKTSENLDETVIGSLMEHFT